MIKFSHSLLILCVFILGFSTCKDDDQPNNPVVGTITDKLEADSDFSTLAAALKQTGLDANLRFPNTTYTLFAPTNAAFAAAGVDLASLSNEELTDILLYHLVTGSLLRSVDLKDGALYGGSSNNSSPGDNALTLFVNKNGATITANNANVVKGDIIAVNGVIHGIDMLLMPPSAADLATIDGRFSVLLQALTRTGLNTVLADSGSYTVFAPTDAAFAASGIDLTATSDDDLRQLLLYHVLGKSTPAGDIADGMSFPSTLSTAGPNGSNLSLILNKQKVGDDEVVTVNESATVITANLFSTNGVVHVIDQVLEMQEIVDFVTKASATDSLASALTAAGLVPALSVDGPFTVFAPNNAAFAAAADTIATLTATQLQTVLTYHVLNGNVRSTQLVNGDVPTLNTQNITVKIGKDADDKDLPPVLVTPDGTEVNFVTTDIQATNGVIHLIDGVLLPKLN